MKEEDMDYEDVFMAKLLNQIGHGTLRMMLHANAAIEFARITGGKNVKEFFDANEETVNEIFGKTTTHAGLEHMISRNGVINGEEGMTFWNMEFDIIKRFLPDDAVTVERDEDEFDGDWNDHAYFVKWSDIMRIDFDAFDVFINESISRYLSVEEKYEEIKKGYNEYLGIQRKFDCELRGR